MQEWGMGAGLAALAFWGFIAAVVVAGVWYSIRAREAQHETLRRLIESGQPIDPAWIDKLTRLDGASGGRPDRDFRVTALWIIPVAVGLAVFGLVLGSAVPEARAPLVGVAGMLLCMGVGFLIAARIASRWSGD